MKNSAKKTTQYYLRHVRQFPKLALPAVIILPINSLINNYLPPLVLASILNRLSRHDYQSHQVWSSFGPSIILFFALSLVGGTVMWRLFDVFFWRLEGKVQRSIAQQVFNKLINESASFHANQFGGSLVSANSKLIGSYVRLADTTAFQVVPLFVGLVFVTLVMIGRAPLYAGLLLGFAIFYISISFFVTSKVRQRGAELARAESQQTGVLADAITNVMAIKSFARENHERQRFEEATNTTYVRLMAMMRAFQRQQIVMSSITGILMGVSLLSAIISVVTFNANLATAFLIFNYTSSIVSQLFAFSNNALRNFNRSFGDAIEMINILEAPPEVLDPVKPETVRMTKGAIKFDHVVFTHEGSDDALFEDLNITIPAGQRVGLVGHSGSGKSTFTRVMLRFSDIDAGAITIDGQNIAAVSQDDLHSKIAYVPQEPLLFHRSIMENIAYGNQQADEAAIRTIAQQAHAAEFIDTLPDGYDTLVGERGVKLSGGQRQRIAIARAMLKNAPIILLDEATSALDSESEVLIQDALWKLMQGRTAIVIAHRLSTIQKMDRIIVMDNGAIAEEGTHKQLLANKGTYAKLWAHQSGGFVD